MKKKEIFELSQAIIKFYEKLFSWENDIARHTGLSTQQNHTIGIVGNEGPLRMKPLAKHLSVTMGSLTVMIDRLEKGGYVCREKDPEDGRGFNIILTGKGLAVHREHHAFHLKLAEDIAGLLDNIEASNLAAVLSKINKGI